LLKNKVLYICGEVISCSRQSNLKTGGMSNSERLKEAKLMEFANIIDCNVKQIPKTQTATGLLTRFRNQHRSRLPNPRTRGCFKLLAMWWVRKQTFQIYSVFL